MLTWAIIACAPKPTDPPASPTSEASPTFAASVTERDSEPGLSIPPVATVTRAKRSSLAVTSLEVPGFLPAVLLVPSGDEQRPLVAAAHGAGGSPEWECEYWARLTQGRAFVLCLRGTAMGHGAFYYKNHYALRDELAAALTAARTAQPRIAPGGGIYAGFSQGASMGSLMIAERGADFPLLVLIEGFVQWNLALARKHQKSGGKKVLFACGTAQCASKAEPSVVALQRSGLEARLDHASGAGHTPLGGVLELVERDLPWLVEGAKEWE
jgi:predicted esterase